MEPVTLLRAELPSAASEVLLFAHASLVWVLVNYVHRLDPVGRAAARRLDEETLVRWRAAVVVRAGAGALAVAALAGFGVAGLALGGLLLAGAVALPLLRLRWMRGGGGAAGRDFRPEWELAANALYLAGSALLIGSAGLGMELTVLALPVTPEWVARALAVASGALFLLRGGTHLVRGVLEKTETLPEGASALTEGELRHGVTIGNIERLLVYLFALTGSHAAIGLVVAAKGVVRAVEWRDRAMVEYFLIGTLASAGLATVVGMGLRWALGTG